MSAKWVGGNWMAPSCNPCAKPGGLAVGMYTTACPCMAAGEIAARTGRTYAIDCAGSVACAVCWPAITGFNPISVPAALCSVGMCWASSREAVKDRFGIDDGSAFWQDMIKVTLCAPCQLAQELNELSIRDSLQLEGSSAPAEIPSQHSMSRFAATGEARDDNDESDEVHEGEKEEDDEHVDAEPVDAEPVEVEVPKARKRTAARRTPVKKKSSPSPSRSRGRSSSAARKPRSTSRAASRSRSRSTARKRVTAE